MNRSNRTTQRHLPQASMSLRVCWVVLLLLAVGGITGSCSSFTPHDKETGLIGTWQWVSSTGGFVGETVTPDSSGYSDYRISFSPDSTFKVFTKDSTRVRGHFSLKQSRGDTLVTYDRAEEFSEGFYPDQYVRFRDDGTLILSDNCADCYINLYRRVN